MGIICKVCFTCKIEKPEEEFNKSKQNIGGLRGFCKACQKLYMQEYQEKNREKLRKQNREAYWQNKEWHHKYHKNWRKHNARLVRNTNYKRKFGITIDDFDEILKKQGGACALCGKHEWNGKRISVDHDHNSGKVRGLLCNRCNTALGALGDTVESIEKVLQYLKGNLILETYYAS